MGRREERSGPVPHKEKKKEKGLGKMGKGAYKIETELIEGARPSDQFCACAGQI